MFDKLKLWIYKLFLTDEEICKKLVGKVLIPLSKNLPSLVYKVIKVKNNKVYYIFNLSENKDEDESLWMNGDYLCGYFLMILDVDGIKLKEYI